MIAGRYGGTGLLIAETLAAGLTMRGQLRFGIAANVGRVISRAAPELGLAVHVADDGCGSQGPFPAGGLSGAAEDLRPA
ncbi:MAG: hypothetical protein ACR2MN_12975 [Acidimicrobiales bacterium]